MAIQADVCRRPRGGGCTLNGEKKCGILPFFSPLSRSELPLAKPSHLAIKNKTSKKSL